MKPIKIYLAGKMGGLTFEEMNSWREEAKELFSDYYNCELLLQNPCDYYNFERDPGTYTQHEVKEFDLWLVKNCDIVLANLNYNDSIGTTVEIELASRIWNKPVIGFSQIENHPWIDLALTKKCKTIEEAVKHILDFYIPNI